MNDRKTDWKLVALLVLVLAVLPLVVVLTVVYHEKVLAAMREMTDKVLAKAARNSEEKTITIELGGR